MSKRTFFLRAFLWRAHIWIKFFGRGNFEFEAKCKCKNAAPQKVCNFCFSVRYILNFKCHKVCMNRLPDVLIDKVVPLDDYLKKIDCDPFF